MAKANRWSMMARAVAFAALLTGLASGLGSASTQNGKRESIEIPAFQFDAAWPKPLPNHWNTGNIGAMVIDSRDHVWIAHRPATTTSLSENYALTGEGECCSPAPPILEFDPDGNLVQSWG